MGTTLPDGTTLMAGTTLSDGTTLVDGTTTTAETTPMMYESMLDGASMNFAPLCAAAWDSMPGECSVEDAFEMCRGDCPTYLKAIEDACSGDFFPLPYEHINVGMFASYRSALCAGDCPSLLDALKMQCDPGHSTAPCAAGCFVEFDEVNKTCGELPWISAHGGQLREGTFFSTEGDRAHKMHETMCDNPQCMNAMMSVKGACSNDGMDMSMNMPMNMCSDECMMAFGNITSPECRPMLDMGAEMEGQDVNELLGAMEMMPKMCNREIDVTVAPTATSEEPTMHKQETADMPAGTAEAHMEIDVTHTPTATSEEPTMHKQETADPHGASVGLPWGPNGEIDANVAPTATSEEPTVHRQETADPHGASVGHPWGPNGEIDATVAPTASSEEPTMLTETAGMPFA